MTLSRYDYALLSTHAYEAVPGQEIFSEEDDDRFFNGGKIIKTFSKSIADGDTGFFAVAYEFEGEVVISYEGTNFSEELLLDARNGWIGGAGVWYSDQSIEAVRFYNEVWNIPQKWHTLSKVI